MFFLFSELFVFHSEAQQSMDKDIKWFKKSHTKENWKIQGVSNIVEIGVKF